MSQNHKEPILFEVFMVGVGKDLKSKLALYADDLTLYSTAQTREEQRAELQHDLRALERWCFRMRLDINPSK